MVVLLKQILELRLHVVAQIVEAELVVGTINHIAFVTGDFVFGTHAGINERGCHTQKREYFAHPFAVTFGKIVVHGNDMHAFASQRVQIGRKGRDERFAFARLHLCNVALMQKDSAHQLGIESPQAKRTFRRLAAIGESLGQQIIKCFALGQTFFELRRFGLQLCVAQRFEFGFEGIDLRDDRSGRLDLAVVRRSEDLFGKCSESQHAFSSNSDFS